MSKLKENITNLIRLRVRPRGSPITIFLLLLISILILLQINHSFGFTSSSLVEEITEPVTTVLKDSADVPKDNSIYGQQQGTNNLEEFQVIKVKPDKPASAKEPTKSIDYYNEQPSNSVVYQINDYPEEDDYYKDFDFKDYSNLDDIDEKLIKSGSFKDFINNKLFKAISDAKPNIGPINNKKHYNGDNPNPTSWDKKMPVVNGKLRENNGVDPIRSKNYLKSFFQLSEEELNEMIRSHSSFIEQMPQEYPETILNNVNGSGILYCGGGNYNWLVLLSLKLLRETGSKLPVEVFIPTESEYSQDLCERVFPLFGAKCLIMSNYLDTKQYKIKGYQLKSMALLLTSFENVLMLDSDNIPLKNPDYLFINEPYKSKNMVVWPDFWRRSTSPLYYEIAGRVINETNQVRHSYLGDDRDFPEGLNTNEDYNSKVSYHDLEGTFPEASSETGQLLINKKTHQKAIFLSLYYNYYGPNYYYPLFSQGQAGEGDKETFLASAHFFDLPYYQVDEFIREFGELRKPDSEDKSDVDFEIAAMGQYDPIIDNIQRSQPEVFRSNFPYDRTKNNYYFHKYKSSEILFLHCNQPKLYPWKINGNGFKAIHDKDGNRRRLYSKILVEELGYDIELKIWKTMEWVLCKHGDFNIKGMKDPGTWCQAVKDQIEFLKSDVPQSFVSEESIVGQGTDIVDN
ncbi:hypothetical protein WICMUC_002441 [Wickerhamomyces mucosus]|uniref:Alpha-1,2-mannosyltransferase n=1 Tax=Wickerhamomyces mucosus TaxID=1378264 RepID=A0A9P8TEG4_9ASCO|nr:hypothetical protein WICMUC_002441 [Wickerhamomyces mucosus]